MRSNPVIVAAGAATVGVLLGGFVAVQLLATPAKHDSSAVASHAAIEAKAPPHIAEIPGPETTGSAPAVEAVTASNCDRQTWPNISRDCMKNGGARVMPAAAPPIAPTPAVTVSNPPPAAAPPIASAVAASPQSAPAVVAKTEANSEPTPEVNVESKSKQVARKAKRSKHRAPAKQELNEDDSSAFADDDDRDDRAERRADRSRRVGQRWTVREREYDVPESDGDGQRRVTVRRGGGPFGALFGAGDDD